VPRRRPPPVVLEGDVEELPLLDRAEEEEPHVVPRDRDAELERAAVVLPRIEREERGGAAQVARVLRLGRAGRLGVDPRRGVEDADHPDPAAQGAGGGDHQSVEAVVPPVGEGAVVLVRGPAGPVIGPLASGDVHQPRDGGAVPGREAVGDERRLLQHVRRDLRPGAVGRGVELVLHPHAVEHEGLLAGTAAADALVHCAAGEGQRVVERGDREVPEVLRGDPLRGGGGEGVEDRVALLVDHEALHLHRHRGHAELEVHRLAAADLKAVPPDLPVPDAEHHQGPGAGPDLADAEAAPGVGGRPLAGAEDPHLGPAQRGPAHRVDHPSGDGPVDLGGQRVGGHPEEGDPERDHGDTTTHDARRTKHEHQLILRRYRSVTPLTGSRPSITRVCPSGESAGRRQR